MSVIYLDHAATTPVLPEVMEAMLPYYKEKYGNPSSAYEAGIDRKKEIEDVRAFIAESIHALPEEIFFTSGGTESDNWALKGIRDQYINQNIHIVTSSIEHHAILHSCGHLQSKNVDVTCAKVGEDGIISLTDVENSFRDETVLVSVMYANNEVGTIQPVKKLCYLCKQHYILFHTDAVQAYGHIPIDVKSDGIDMLSASAHKFGGPKGIGFLYIGKNILLPSFIHGGGQEKKRRAGTENVAGIIGMGKAARIAMDHMEADADKTRRLRDYLEKRLLSEIPYARINGSREKDNRLPGHCSISFQCIQGPELVALLDSHGICVSAGSACNSGSREISHVLKAMKVPEEMAAGTVRLTLGPENTIEEIEKTIAVIKNAVESLRKKSSIYEDFQLAKQVSL